MALADEALALADERGFVGEVGQGQGFVGQGHNSPNPKIVVRTLKQ